MLAYKLMASWDVLEDSVRRGGESEYDSGIRGGSEVVKGLGLGGRAYIMGKAGLRHVMNFFAGGFRHLHDYCQVGGRGADGGWGLLQVGSPLADGRPRKLRFAQSVQHRTPKGHAMIAERSLSFER